jgi:purine-binding chemotaxis protein CheW
VLDLAVKFGLPETAVTKRTCILIVEAALGGERGVVGVMADAVQEVLELGPADIEPPPSFGTHVRVDYLVGLGKATGGFVVLLDLDRVIRASEEELTLQLSARPAPEELAAAAAPPGVAESAPG